MSSAAQPKIFGIRLGVDPKILVGVLIALAVALFWYNSRSDEVPASSAVATRPVESAPTTNPAVGATPKIRTATRRRVVRNDRGTIQLRTVDPTHGDVDPVLRLDLLARLHNVQASSAARNLFEGGTAAEMAAVPVRTIMPKPMMPIVPATPAYPPTSQAPPPLNIPLKYYGFAKPATQGEANQGFFLSGDDILVAAEGQLVKDKYLVVQITPTSARMEDTQVKQSQTLPVVPEAVEQ